jgi:hypothetical protein
MKFLHLVDTDGRRHLVNPAHVSVIQEADVGCVVHMRGRGVMPIVLNETVEVMGDALETLDDVEHSTVSRWRR